MTTTTLNFLDKFGGTAADDVTSISAGAQIEICDADQTFALNIEDDALTLTSHEFESLFNKSQNQAKNAFYETTIKWLKSDVTKNALKDAYNTNLSGDARREVFTFPEDAFMTQLHKTSIAIEQVTMKSDIFTKSGDKLRLVYTFVINDSIGNNAEQKHKVAINHKWVASAPV